MTQQEILKLRQRISSYIDKRRLRDAIFEIRQMANRRMAWEIEDRLKIIEQNYAYMLRYLTDGATDPDRINVYNGLVNDIYTVLDSLISYIEVADNPSLYYSNLRYLKLQANRFRLQQMLDDYRKSADKVSLFSLVMSSENSDEKKDRAHLETVQSEIFMKLWVTPQLNSEETSLVNELIESPQIRTDMKQHVLSAITLGLLQQYDKRRLQILMSAYMTADDMKVSSAALVGLLLGLWKYSNRPLTRSLNEQLMSLKDKPSWSNDLRITFIEMIRARDTERINRKMRDELLPKMDKLRPDMIDKINKVNLESEDPMSLQENPEWQELLDKSGISDQLKELTEIQLEGGDVMMSTFSHLKQFPFFQNIANWFLPFDPQHTSVSETIRQLDIIGDMMETSKFMCDSDKYSFMFAIKSVPENQRDLMLSQMKAQSGNIYEAMSNMASDTEPESRRLAVNSYMQNIYRFFKLFQRKNEFFDPFDKGINLISVPSLADDFDDVELLQIVAEFYFKLQYMREALEVYDRLEALSTGDSSRYQKIGYCYERLGILPKAVEYYEKAELLDGTSSWTIKRLAATYRALGDKEASLKRYRQLATMNPDDLHAAMLYGRSLLDNGDFKEALHEFYKVEFLDEKSTQIWRPLAWTLFLTGDFEGAKNYYSKILMDSPSANDYLNMGHVELAAGNMREAVNDYSLAIQKSQGDREWLVKALSDDAPSLKQAGVDLNILPLIADATAYTLND